MSSFRVALSADFRKADGSPSFAEFDLSPLQDHPDIDLFFLEPEPEISAAQLADVDALILLTPRVGAGSLTPNGRLAVVARFGVGYDNVDLAACSAHDVAVVITPDSVRRPVAVSILTLIFALSGKLFVKDRLARRGPAGWAEKTVHNGVGLVGLTLGSVGVGNIGAEMFRLARPLDMRFIAHDPYVGPALAAELGVTLTDLDSGIPRSRLRLRELPSFGRDPPPRRPGPSGADEADRLPHQHRAGTDRRSGGADRGAAGPTHRRCGTRRLRAGAAGRRRSRCSPWTT